MVAKPSANGNSATAGAQSSNRMRGRRIATFDEQTGIRLVPSMKIRAEQRGTPYKMRTNDAGFRTHPFTSKERVSHKRVLVFGDSFTEGVGVSDGKRYTDVLEELNPGVEVLNFGVRATGTDQQFLFFREQEANFDYDLVVVGLYAHDVRRNYSRFNVLTTEDGAFFEKPFFRVEDGELVLHNVPVPKSAMAYGEMNESQRELVYNRGLKYRIRREVARRAPWAKEVLQRVSRYQPAPYFQSASNPAWRLTTAIIQQWQREARSPLLIVAIPPHQYIRGTASPKGYRARFRELGSLPGVTVHDPLDDFLKLPREQLPGLHLSRDDGHFTAAGHRVLADSLSPVVRDLLDEDAD